MSAVCVYSAHEIIIIIFIFIYKKSEWEKCSKSHINSHFYEHNKSARVESGNDEHAELSKNKSAQRANFKWMVNSK